ncbi:alpha-isopropylmalate synthase regulatory domain-containing protein, partial [Haloarcula hispanica]
ERKEAAVGSGPVDAAMNAAEVALSHTADATLEDYHVDAITGGTDALVTVEIEMSRGDDHVVVSASDSDITRASVRAMVDAMDRLVTDDEDPLVADD